MIPIINQSIQLSKFYYCQCHQKREWYFFLHGAKRLAGHFFSSKFHWDVATLISYHSEKSKLFILENSSMRMKIQNKWKRIWSIQYGKTLERSHIFPVFLILMYSKIMPIFLYGALKLAAAMFTYCFNFVFLPKIQSRK